MGIGPQRLGTAKGFTPCGSPMKQTITRPSYSEELQQGAFLP